MVALEQHILPSMLPDFIMYWLDDALHELSAAESWSYHRGQPSAAEPVAFAALALLCHGRIDEAHRPLAWLSGIQADDGSVGITSEQRSPHWPTSLAVIAWRKADEIAGRGDYRDSVTTALASLLRIKGKPLERWKEGGHDTTLIGWPWVESTHSWVEPTAYAVLALKAAGCDDHPRTREAVRLLIDRLLPDGGCNYGNTFMLGQCLRPHLQTSGAALAAIADERDPSGRLERTATYLQANLSARTTSVSLSFGVLGLGAYGALPEVSDRWLEAAAHRTFQRSRSPYQLALLALAAKANMFPLGIVRAPQPT
jgi:hypothetical protein